VAPCNWSDDLHLCVGLSVGVCDFVGHASADANPLARSAMIDFLMQERHLTRDDSYMLARVAADLEITERRRWQQRRAYGNCKAIFATKR